MPFRKMLYSKMQREILQLKCLRISEWFRTDISEEWLAICTKYFTPKMAKSEKRQIISRNHISYILQFRTFLVNNFSLWEINSHSSKLRNPCKIPLKTATYFHRNCTHWIFSQCSNCWKFSSPGHWLHIQVCDRWDTVLIHMTSSLPPHCISVNLPKTKPNAGKSISHR